LNDQIKQEANNVKKLYELELKTKNLANENRELEDSYTALLTANNQKEFMFHKRINELRGHIQEAKKCTKTQTKEVEKELRQLSAAVLGPNDKSSIFIGATSIKEQFAELTKEIIKCNKKEVNQVIYEKEAIIEDLKLAVGTGKAKIEELSFNLEKARAARQDKKERNSIILNGHGNVSKSTSSKA
jgi:hypothetical protein